MFSCDAPAARVYTLSLHDALPIFSAEVDLVHQQTQNQRYGSSHIGATANDISNVVTDAASGVVDMRNILCSSANMREIGRAVQQECRDRTRMQSSALNKRSPEKIV